VTSIFIIASTPVLRAGLRTLLSYPDMEVVGEGAALEELPFPAPAEVVVASVDGSVLFPLAMAGWVEQPRPPGLVLLLDEPDITRIGRSLQNSSLPGWAILTSAALGAELLNAVKVVAQGYVLISRSNAQLLFDQRSAYDGIEPPALDDPLTGREQEVLQLLSQGLSNKLIARQLQISEHTVKFHVSALYTKLEATSRTEAISRGVRLGLITL
jgi:DNA-binding NarL/FixJ family response regulator